MDQSGMTKESKEPHFLEFSEKDSSPSPLSIIQNINKEDAESPSSSNSSIASGTTTTEQIPKSQSPITKPSISRIQPPTELMQRLKSFLPELRKANTELAKLDPKTYSIEDDDDDAEQVIELNLGLGVFEEKTNNNINNEQEESLERLKLPGEEELLDGGNVIASDSESDSESSSNDNLNEESNFILNK